jgi:DUF2971 family protein
VSGAPFHYKAKHLGPRADSTYVGADGRVRLFLDLFRQDNFAPNLEFFIACFSRARDDLRQWRTYADNGRGVAIGLSPSLFAVADTPPAGQLPEFVGPVRYSLADVCGRHEACLEEAAASFLAAANANADLLADKTVGIPFMDRFVREIIASPLIWNCLTSKHPAYEHEQEVRLVMMGMPATVAPFVTTRFRAARSFPTSPIGYRSASNTRSQRSSSVPRRRPIASGRCAPCSAPSESLGTFPSADPTFPIGRHEDQLSSEVHI